MLVDPNRGDERPFTFDYSFWSHDGFRVDDNGIFVPTSPKYADQNVVYEALGKQVLDNAWEGYNCCLFAYGQTGSGKSYSMVSDLFEGHPLIFADQAVTNLVIDMGSSGTVQMSELCPFRAHRSSRGSGCRQMRPSRTRSS